MTAHEMNESEWWFEDEYDLELEPDFEYEPTDYESDPLYDLEYLPSGLVVPKSEKHDPMPDVVEGAACLTGFDAPPEKEDVISPAESLTVEILDKVIEDMKVQGSIPYKDLFLHPEIWEKLKEQSEVGKALIDYDYSTLELKVAAATPEIFEEIYGKQQRAEESWVVPDWD